MDLLSWPIISDSAFVEENFCFFCLKFNETQALLSSPSYEDFLDKKALVCGNTYPNLVFYMFPKNIKVNAEMLSLCQGRSIPNFLKRFYRGSYFLKIQTLLNNPLLSDNVIHSIKPLQHLYWICSIDLPHTQRRGIQINHMTYFNHYGYGYLYQFKENVRFMQYNLRKVWQRAFNIYNMLN